MFLVAILNYVVSRQAGSKLRRIYDFVSAGFEGEEQKRMFAQKFDELDGDGDGIIGKEGLQTLATQAGRKLSRSEADASALQCHLTAFVVLLFL